MIKEFKSELLGIIDKHSDVHGYNIKRVFYCDKKLSCIYLIEPVSFIAKDLLAIETCKRLKELEISCEESKIYTTLINSFIKDSRVAKLFFELEDFRRKWLLPREQQHSICEYFFKNDFYSYSLGYSKDRLKKLIA